jgi:enoyl-CoA hydratase
VPDERVKYTDIIVDRSKPPIGYITINRPDKRNTLTNFPGGTCDQLAQAYLDMADDPEIRVFILKGAGECFSAGFDLSGPGITAGREKGWAKGREKEPWARYSVKFPNNTESRFHQRMWWAELWENPKPSIALVHSFCLGAGLWNVNLCDIRLATPEAVFAYPPIRFGSSIESMILQPWLLGLTKTMDMALTGRYITAQEAYDCGLITKIVPEDKLEVEGRKYAESIARVPPMTNYFTKLSVHKYYEMLGIKDWLELGYALTMLMEHASLPGGNFWLTDKIVEKGFKEAYKQLLDNYGYPDEIREREITRLKAKKGSN